jgi:uncharacterized damage-inducible protein DinB
MATIGEMLQELEREAPTTRRALERVRADKLDWKPHEKSMTLGVLAMHVATIPARLAELAMQPSLDVGFVVPRPTTTSIPALLEAHDQSVARAREIVGSMDDSALETPWRMMNGNTEIFTMPRGIFLRSILFNHWYHHRGQLSVYLRETGALVPSIYGASADERPF